MVRRRLGKGATALALLVERDGREHVLKVALSPDNNARLEIEAEVLRPLRHQFIVELHGDVLRFGNRVGLLMARPEMPRSPTGCARKVGSIWSCWSASV